MQRFQQGRFSNNRGMFVTLKGVIIGDRKYLIYTVEISLQVESTLMNELPIVWNWADAIANNVTGKVQVIKTLSNIGDRNIQIQ